MPLQFKGVAHPPPSRTRKHNADMCGGEIGSTNLGRGVGTELLYEHDHGAQVGRVMATWEGPRGELRVHGVVDDDDVAASVRTGATRGLSLGTSVMTDDDGKRISTKHDELSLCAQPRRGGCWVDELDGKSVRTTARFSNRGARSLAIPNNPSRTQF